MQDETNKMPLLAEKRKPIRPRYKDRALTWRNLFIGTVGLCLLMVYLLGMVLKGNYALQREATHASAVK